VSTTTTRVALVTVPGSHNVYLRFGKPVRRVVIDARRQVAEFAPGAIFCRIRWHANAYGTLFWQLVVLQAAIAGERCQHITGIVPSAELLLAAEGAARVQAALRLIDAIEANAMDAARVPARYWRVAHHRLAVRADIVPYGDERRVADRLGETGA
jgi:hypothetical protein